MTAQRKQAAQSRPGAGKRAQERRVAQLRTLLEIPQAEQRLTHPDRIEKERRQAPSPSKLNQKRNASTSGVPTPIVIKNGW